MTLEEAIQHCKDMARLNEAECFECAEEHRQLAEWLTELKAYREKEPKQGEWGRDGHCTECGYRKPFEYTYYSSDGITIYSANFCPNCGARMKEGDEK